MNQGSSGCPSADQRLRSVCHLTVCHGLLRDRCPSLTTELSQRCPSKVRPTAEIDDIRFGLHGGVVMHGSESHVGTVGEDRNALALAGPD